MNSKPLFFIIILIAIAGIVGYSVGHESFNQEKTLEPGLLFMNGTGNISTMNETISNTELVIIHENGVQLVEYEETTEIYEETETTETTEYYEENGTENPAEYFTGDETGVDPVDYEQDSTGAELEKNYYENGNPEYN